MRRLAVVAAVLIGTLGSARADVLDQIAQKIVAADADAENLDKGLQTPKSIRNSGDEIERRFVEAQVSYGVGNYADASIMLYDIVENHKESKSWKEAVFYLADALYNKGDSLTAREYFRKIVYDFGEKNARYPKALERLLELSLKIKDDADVQDVLDRLDRLPRGNLLPSAPYVRGKFAYFTEDFDTAIRVLGGIPKTSPYYFQARYFMGAAYIAKDELASAAKVFHGLLREPVKTKKQKRIVELTHMALGRIHYERQQPTDAIEHYLMVSRRSDLFASALYEVAYVYVQAKQFDKALRALELLEMATGGTCARIDKTAEKTNRQPTAIQMPEVCILKGNLEVRKAQAITSEQGAGNSNESYEVALQIFETTRTAYKAPRDQLKKLADDKLDPKKFFVQITRMGGEAFTTDVELPEVARKYIREEPEVARVIAVTGDLVSIRKELEDTGVLLDRLENAVNSPTRVQIFPGLARQREKATELSELTFDLRMQLATHERALIARHATDAEKADLAKLGKDRQDLAAKLAAMPNSGDKYGERIKKARNEYEELEKKAAELETEITSIEAILTAVQVYYQNSQGAVKLDKKTYDESVKEITTLIADLRTELDAIRKELQQAKEEAGIGDDLAVEQRDVREALYKAIRKEHEYHAKIIARMSGKDRAKADQIATLISKLDAIDAYIDRANRKIDKILDAELAEVRDSITEEKARLAGYKRELEAYEAENEDLGSEIIYASFTKVTEKFYEITVRADVGRIDVGWARKEEAEGELKKITQDAAREKRILDNEMPDSPEPK